MWSSQCVSLTKGQFCSTLMLLLFESTAIFGWQKTPTKYRVQQRRKEAADRGGAPWRTKTSASSSRSKVAVSRRSGSCRKASRGLRENRCFCVSLTPSAKRAIRVSMSAATVTAGHASSGSTASPRHDAFKAQTSSRASAGHKSFVSEARVTPAQTTGVSTSLCCAPVPELLSVHGTGGFPPTGGSPRFLQLHFFFILPLELCFSGFLYLKFRNSQVFNAPLL